MIDISKYIGEKFGTILFYLGGIAEVFSVFPVLFNLDNSGFMISFS